MKILSIQVGKPKAIHYQGQTVTTGIFKDPVPGPVMLRMTNLDGDGQADLSVHGGIDKALYAYSCDAYSEWKTLRPQDSFSFGAMGENLTLDVLPEDAIFIGDVFQVGAAQVQVSQPRFPCSKLGVMYKDPAILKQFMNINRPGVYFRVLKEGLIDVGDEFKLISSETVRFSVIEMFLLKQNVPSPDRILEILQLTSLPEKWKKDLKAKLPRMD